MSIQIKNEYLPKDTKSLIPRNIEEQDFKDYNFAIIYRLPNIEEKKGKINIRINEEIDKFKWEEGWIEKINQRFQKVLDDFKNSGFEVFPSHFPFPFPLSWRMVIGLGGTHPQETSMTLHHIYGIPYIPGSAVKGVTRHWVILSKFNNDEVAAEGDEDFKNIFGTQTQAGKVIFFDAYPVGNITLKMDIMNPHYPDYYSGKKKDSKEIPPPADWQNPNPIKFLTVEKTMFNFYLASRDSELLNKAAKWLKEALKKYGIGAKTSLGYGLFEIDEKS